MVTVRLPAILIQQIDDWAVEHSVTRSDAIRAALEALVKLGGLDQEPEPVKAAPSPKPKPVPKVEKVSPVHVEVPLFKRPEFRPMPKKGMK